jgi:hypothetical protein
MSPKTSPKEPQAADDSSWAFSENDPKGNNGLQRCAQFRRGNRDDPGI